MPTPTDRPEAAAAAAIGREEEREEEVARAIGLRLVLSRPFPPGCPCGRSTARGGGP